MNFVLGYVFGSKLAERVANPFAVDKKHQEETGKDEGPKEVSSIFKKYTEKANDKIEESTSSEGPSTSQDRFKASMEEFAKKNANGIDIGDKIEVTTGEEGEKTLFNVILKKINLIALHFRLTASFSCSTRRLKVG